MKNSKSGFTLVEIMIVVLIIGLLAAIAIPSLSRARKTAQKNACIENLRQINSAYQQYFIEESTTNVPATTSTDIHRYFQRQELPACPSSGTYTAPVNESNVPTCSQSALGHEL